MSSPTPSPPLWIDTHCHLDAEEFAADRDRVIAAAGAAGIVAIVVPAVDIGNFAAVQDCCTRFQGIPICLPAYGIHPMYTPAAEPEHLDILRQWLQRPPTEAHPVRPVAIGEVGLDYYLPNLDPARQEFFFVEQLKLAREYGLPVLLHVRRAVDAVLKQIRRIFGTTSHSPGGIAHAFNGSRQQAEEFIKLGFKLGFGGAMTWPRATRLRSLAATLPLETIVLETDAPDIPPLFAESTDTRRPRNEPAYLPRIAQTLADLRGVPLEIVAAQTRENALSALNLKESGKLPGTSDIYTRI